MNYLIYGLGISGISAAQFLSQNHKIIITDDNELLLEKSKNILGTNIEFKKFNEIDFSTINKVIFSPGIPLYFKTPHPILEKKTQYGFELICDLEEFYQLNHDNSFIGITGTNGKSTTTALTHHIFESLNIKANMGGNIGQPPFSFDKKDKNTNYIFEYSSFQLDLLSKTKLNIASILNISPDHLDRHGNLSNYIQSKSNIFNNQTAQDYALLNYDDENLKPLISNLKAKSEQKILTLSTIETLNNDFSYIGDEIYINTSFFNDKIELKHQYLKGEHNKQNILFSLAITLCFLAQNNLDINLDKIINIIKSFKGLKHRQELVRTINNINFVNDSKATNSQSTQTALRSYENIFLIMGGREKDSIEAIIKDLKQVKKIYLIGEASDNFGAILQKNSIDFVKNKELNIALKNAYLDAKKLNHLDKLNILLSPACSSYDQFKNFEERGEYFCKIVNELQES